ncbi:hypothetical protein ACIPW9_10925 [Streptomyces sp. NPDC090052]|uniref:hypothetical protein n=1 Tax=Streptomyces sp. NPDC090052 TaxID=3365931 RepID=UPI00380F2EE8
MREDLVSAAFGPDGGTLALTIRSTPGASTGTVDSHIALWDAGKPSSAQLLGTFAYDEDFESSPLSYSSAAQGPPLLASMDAPATVWNTDPAFMIKVMCLSAGDVITRDEWSRYVPNAPYAPPCS